MAAQTVKTEFDQADYDALLKYYYEPIVQHNVELPGGRTLRRQTSPPRIEQDSLGFTALRKTIDGLKKSSAPDSHNKIYQLLRELNAWQTRPPSLGGSLPSWQRGSAEESAVTETIDLTAEETVIDVDAYIIDVLLVGVLQPKPDPDGGAPRMVAVSEPAPFVKREADGDEQSSAETEAYDSVVAPIALPDGTSLPRTNGAIGPLPPIADEDEVRDDELAARPMPPKKRKASAAWEEECAALIASGDKDAVRAIAAKLESLQRSVSARFDLLDDLRRRAKRDEHVRLIESQESIGAEVRGGERDSDDESREHSIYARFTAGPNAAAFDMYFKWVDVDATIDDGDETMPSSMEFRTEIFSYWKTPGGKGRVMMGKDGDALIATFLQKAGLSDNQPRRAAKKDERYNIITDGWSDSERRRWLYGDVIYDAAALALEKHDANFETNDYLHGVPQRWSVEYSALYINIQVYHWLGFEYYNPDSNYGEPPRIPKPNERRVT